MNSQEPIFNRSEALRQIRERWISNLAHDLSGSLFSARGYVRMALSRPGLTAESKMRLEDALLSLDRAISSAKELVASPVDKLELSSFALRELIAEEMQRAGAAFARKHVYFANEFSSESLVIVGDRAILSRAIEGLLSASAECAGSGGTVKVAGEVTAARITLQVTAAGRDAKPDLIAASGLWQLHGGTILTHEDDEEFAITCELPVIRIQQLEKEASQ